jgi:hypothetical protein
MKKKKRLKPLRAHNAVTGRYLQLIKMNREKYEERK